MLQSLKTQWKRSAGTQDAPARTAAPAVDVTGRWDVHIEYAANTSKAGWAKG